MNILLTGCTSQQCNPDASKHIANYASLLRRAFHASGHDVHWMDPSISWKSSELLHRYDHIIVGLAPVTSLSANRVYGALSVISELMHSNPNKLSILVDAPEPERIAAGNRAIMSHPQNLTKVFYSYRKEFELAVREQDRLLACVDMLSTETWPTTIVPALPWDTDERTDFRLPYRTRKTVSLNLDGPLLQTLAWPEIHHRQEVWTTEGDVQQPTTLPLHKIPRKGYAGYDPSVMRQMAGSSGVLIEVPKDGTWWNTRYVQALATNTPVYSSWQETGVLGPAWSVLPMVHETMTPAERGEVARAQVSQFRQGCASENEIKSKVHSILKVKAKASV